MQAVWSLWSRPLRDAPSGRWLSARHHLLGWVLSFETVRRHYPRTKLVTDSHGARLLVEQLGLEFEAVETPLDALAEVDRRFWAIGKLHAYGAQREPFVHIDADVFLWRRLPPALEQAELLAQNPEFAIAGLHSDYQPAAVFRQLGAAGGWLPPVWRGFLEHRPQHALCCGIFGGRALDFIADYSEQAIRLLTTPTNVASWRTLAPLDPNIHAEQYLLAALAHQRSLTAACLFASEQVAYRPGAGRAVGFTHLLGPAKRHPELMKRLEARVRRDYPQRWARVQAMTT